MTGVMSEAEFLTELETCDLDPAPADTAADLFHVAKKAKTS